MTEKQFHQNIEQWALLCPKAAVMLPYLNCEDYVFVKSSNGQLNLKHKKKLFHHQDNPSQEAKEAFDKLDLKDIQVIYVYGVGLGYFYEAAKQWLHGHQSRNLIFLEDDLHVIHRLLETPLGKKILEDTQCQLYFFKGVDDPDHVIDHLVWSFMINPMTVTALALYAKTKKEAFDELHHKIVFDSMTKNAAVREYLALGDCFYANLYRNFLHFEKSYLGNGLFNRFQNVPAIICGAGPSLAKHYELLRGLEDKALIFAGGSSMTALTSQDILPHFGAGVDPFSPQLERLTANRAYEVPFFYRNRLYHEAFKLLHGPRLYLTGAGGYDTPTWLEEQLGIESEVLDEGHNVVNFCLEIAYHLGCNPIIFVGMDLAYTGMKCYAPGVIKDPKVTKKELYDTPGFGNQPLIRKDVHGKPVKTLWKWIAEAKWISDFAKKHPDVDVINATEGGIGFPEVINRPLEGVIRKHLQIPRDLRSRVQGEIQNTTIPQMTKRKLINIVKKLQGSLKRSHGHLQVMLEETQRLREDIKAGKPFPSELMTGRMALAETELGDEAGFMNVLGMFNIIYGNLISQRMRLIRLEKHKKSESEIAERKLALQAEKCYFLQKVAERNLELIEEALKQ